MCFFFREYLEVELSLPQEKLRAITDTAVAYINATLVELRRLFLVEDIIDSLKFAVLLWCLTHIGAWLNGMTLVIIGNFFFLFYTYIFIIDMDDLPTEED